MEAHHGKRAGPQCMARGRSMADEYTGPTQDDLGLWALLEPELCNADNGVRDVLRVRWAALWTGLLCGEE